MDSAVAGTDAPSSDGGQWAWASIPGTRMPVPSHHGHETWLGVPPRFEITRPVPRQAIHSRGSWDSFPGPSLSTCSLATGR